MDKFTPIAGGYGAFRMEVDEFGKWYSVEDVDYLLDVPTGKLVRREIYRCRECLNLFCNDDSPAVENSDDYYCQECAALLTDAAEEQSYAYFNRYIAGDR